MRSVLVLMNHDLLSQQEKELYEIFNVERIVVPGDDLKSVWSQIPTDEKLPIDLLNDFIAWIEHNSLKNDLVLIQGDFGAVFYLVTFCLDHGRIPIYSASVRDYHEEIASDGTVIRHHRYQHRNFRVYSKWEESYV